MRMVKEADKSNLTAAIGDGGNDVSMIQEANLGLGIIGVEGDAAAKAADFSFAKVRHPLLSFDDFLFTNWDFIGFQFRYLQRALFVHGQWYYNRLSTLVQVKHRSRNCSHTLVKGCPT